MAICQCKMIDLIHSEGAFVSRGRRVRTCALVCVMPCAPVRRLARTHRYGSAGKAGASV